MGLLSTRRILDPQKVAILSLLVPSLHINIRADGMSQLPRSLASIIITTTLFQAKNILIIFMPIHRVVESENTYIRNIMIRLGRNAAMK